MAKNICPTYRTDTVDNAWIDIRDNFGPRVPVGSEIYLTDMSEWTTWASSNGIDPTNAVKFSKWLIWLIQYGTVNYGNFPSNKKQEHTGRSWSPCPFDSNCYSAMRSETMLGYTPSSTANHGNFFMKPMYHGVWGMECTYSGCPYMVEYGRPYFYI